MSALHHQGLKKKRLVEVEEEAVRQVGVLVVLLRVVVVPEQRGLRDLRGERRVSGSSWMMRRVAIVVEGISGIHCDRRHH